MAVPRRRSWAKLKRLARYLLEFPKLVWEHGPSVQEDDGDVLDVSGDSDWAGCLRSKRSTSGGVAAIAGGFIKSWSGTQATIALSSGETEYYAAVRAAAEALGIQALVMDMGIKVRVRLWIDAEAAKGIASRCGLGRIRHLETEFLWLQDAVRSRKLALKKVLGTENVVGIATKPTTATEISE